MKKLLSVLLATLMILSSLSVLAFAADKFPAPAAPTGLSLANDTASWDAVENATYYKVKLLKWNYDKNLTTWNYFECGKEYVTENTSLDLKACGLSAGKYIFSVTAYTEYELEKKDGTVSVIKRFSETTVYELIDDVNEPYEVVVDIFGNKEEEDSSIPFEWLVDEDDETGNMLLDIIRKIKNAIMAVLAFLGFVKEKLPEA